jgi:formate-dependent nitrite reductase membrane component NrfD
VGLLMLAVTGVLLVADLDRPSRFWYILARPQWKSWLTIGAFIILAYSILLVANIGLYMLHADEILLWTYQMTMPLAVMTAIYTAFLFAQAKARDLWQNPALPVHLLLHAVIAGASMTTFAAALGDAPDIADFCAATLAVSLCAHLFLTIGGEILMEHGSKAKKRAVEMMVKGPYSKLFWGGGIIAGAILPLLLLSAQAFGVPTLACELSASALALLGLLAYEHCFVMAGQSIRLS